MSNQDAHAIASQIRQIAHAIDSAVARSLITADQAKLLIEKVSEHFISHGSFKPEHLTQLTLMLDNDLSQRELQLLFPSLAKDDFSKLIVMAIIEGALIEKMEEEKRHDHTPNLFLPVLLAEAAELDISKDFESHLQAEFSQALEKTPELAYDFEDPLVGVINAVDDFFEADRAFLNNEEKALERPVSQELSDANEKEEHDSAIVGARPAPQPDKSSNNNDAPKVSSMSKNPSNFAQLNNQLVPPSGPKQLPTLDLFDSGSASHTAQQTQMQSSDDGDNNSPFSMDPTPKKC